MTKAEAEALKVVKRYRREVDLLEDDVITSLALSYHMLTGRIREKLQELDADDHRPLTFRFRQDVRPEIERLAGLYIRDARKSMTQLSREAAKLGINAADASAKKVTKGNWRKVNTAGFCTGGIFKAGREALNRIPAAIADRIGDLVTQAQGMAEQGLDWLMGRIGEVFSGAWSNIQRLIRTVAEQMFRRGQQEQRRQMPVQQWRRCANHQTACLACLMLEGTFYDREEDFSDHPNGRCYIVPVEPGSRPDHAGRDWLEEQDEETQRKIMGKTRFEAWKNGDLTLDQMTDVVPSEEFGPQPHVIPLKELGLTPAK